MKLSDIPSKFNIPFAALAGAGFIRAVPQAPTGTPGQASLQVGFPPENFSPVAAGGVPPFGQDFNGLMNQSTAWSRWQATGRAFPPYDAAFQTAIAGYPEGSIVESLVESFLFYGSLVDDNVTNPDTGGAGWFVWSRKLTVNTDLYVNTSTGNDSNNGLSPATPKKTIGAAVSTAWSFPPSQFTIMIHISDGVYNERVPTPFTPGPPVIITGNAATPTNVLVNGVGGGSTFSVQGPNALTVQNLAVSNSDAASAGFAANSGATLVTSNTVSQSVSGWVFLATNGGTVTVGSHTFSANCTYAFASYQGGNLVLQAGATYTISTAITVSDFAIANDGNITVPATGTPTFSGAVNVTGTRYSATLNGVINTQGQGANYFPGTVAGSTATGGQYA